MTVINRIYRLFASEEIGHGPRMLALLYAIVNLPAVLLALLAIWLWPITIPGMVMYAFFWRSAFRPGSWIHTKGLWTWTIFYNIFFLLISAFFVLEGSFSGAVWVLIPMMLNIGISGVALRSLIDHRAAQEVDLSGSEWNMYEYPNEVESKASDRQAVERLGLESWE